MVGDVTRAVLVHIRQAKAKFGCLFPPAIPSVMDRSHCYERYQYSRCVNYSTYPQKRHNLWAGFGGDHDVETEHP
jgi:hypothetical protein